MAGDNLDAKAAAEMLERQAGAVARAAGAGLRVEQDPAVRRRFTGYRLVWAETSTLAAADWNTPDGFGLTLVGVEAALDALGAV